METLPIEERLVEPDHCQDMWYRLAASWCSGKSVLDIGAGSGYGLEILQQAGASPVLGIDPQPLRDYILAVPVDQVTSKSYDVVVAMDVIEHVERDEEFFYHLIRIARERVFISTPNWNVSRATNPYHVREYTPEELRALLGVNRYQLFTSDSQRRVTAIADFAEAQNNFGVNVDLTRIADGSHLLDHLRCPRCEVNDAILASAASDFVCTKCGVHFPVTSGVPHFLAAAIDAGFDERWKQYPKPQVTTAGVFEQKTGFTSADLTGKTVLDAGCGCGRFLAVAQAMGAHVIGVDGSPYALRAAAENAPGATLVHADLLHLPLRDESVDHAFSIGVLHHTESTERAFREVARTVKRGGSFAVWVYCKPVSDDSLLPAYELMHEITRACPPDKLHAAFAKWAVKVRDSYAGAWGPLQQVLRVSGSKDDEECASDSLDWHAPQYRWHHGVDEVKSWFESAGFLVDRVGSFPTSVRGVKR